VRDFLQLLDQVAAAIEDHEQQGVVATRQRADDRLRELRSSWRVLDPSERAAVQPLAQLLAERLKSADQRRYTRMRTETARQQAGTPADTMILNFGSGDAFDGAEALNELVKLEDVPMRKFVSDGPPNPDELLAWFGYQGFREGQRPAVEAALAGRDCLAILPTGGGKSLCYQLPGVASEKLTIVVSPLIALIFDQHRRLAESGHPSTMLASGLGEDWNREAMEQIASGRARIVFVAPERFGSRAFLNVLAKREIGLFVVDEAHSISEGYAFRPDYLRLGPIAQRLGRPPIMALTATATPEVAKDIVKRLGLHDPMLIEASFDRPNISFDVIPLEGKGAVGRKFDLLAQGLRMEGNRPAIVYCGTRKDVEKVAEQLVEIGIEAVGYHAGYSSDARSQSQTQFMSGAVDVVVATNAFGMGIDKADVRSVWHWALPTSIESYYQEAGRAGRDGQPARAVLLSMRADLGRLINFNKNRAVTVDQVREYTARIRALMKHDRVSIEQPDDDTDRLALSIAERTGAFTIEPAIGGKLEITAIGPLNLARANQYCQQAKEQGWQAYRAIERFSANHDHCRRQTILAHFGDERTPHPIGRCCDVHDPIEWLDLSAPSAGLAPRSKTPRPKTTNKTTNTTGKTTGKSPRQQQPAASLPVIGPPLDEAGMELLGALRAWRAGRSGKSPAYTVAHNEVLEAIARTRPRSVEEFLAIRGVGQTFITKHLTSVLALLDEHA
jgi:ATP-dependent DNA helicase RecQ